MSINDFIILICVIFFYFCLNLKLKIMIKKLLTTVLVSSAFFMGAQSFTASYNFAAVTPTTGVTDPTPVPTATNVTFGSFSAVGAATVSSATGRFAFASWSLGGVNAATSFSAMTGSITTTQYFEVTITPNPTFILSLNSISFTSQRSATGPRSFSVRSSLNSYITNLPAAVGTSTNTSIEGSNDVFYTVDAALTSTNNVVTLPLAGFSVITSPITFRFYVWNAEALAGTFSIDDVIFSGSVSLSTGIGSVNFDLNSNFNVYPVPCNDGIIFIENKHAIEVSKIELMDVLGNVVLSNQATNESKIKLNLADLPSGNYFVKMSSGKQVSVKKIVVIK
jgi:hypothetical protein